MAERLQPHQVPGGVSGAPRVPTMLPGLCTFPGLIQEPALALFRSRRAKGGNIRLWLFFPLAGLVCRML